MRRNLLIALSLLIVTVIIVYFISTSKYSTNEVTTENFNELKETENVNVYEVYYPYLRDYPGIAGLNHMYFGHRENIKNNSRNIQSSHLYETGYTYLGNNNGIEKYRLDFPDCTSFMTENTKDGLNFIYQTISLSCCDNKYNIHESEGYNSCTSELNKIIGERIKLLQIKGFALKESEYKGKSSILIKTTTDQFLIIETDYKEISYAPAFLKFKVYDRKKYSFFNELVKL